MIAPRFDYDVIVAGGGPGGSTTAAFLARAGKKVLLLEREEFPRFHIGESLLPYGNDVLREMGVWEKLEKGGFMYKPGAEFFLGNATKCHRFWFSRELPSGYDHTYQVERARFDDLLFKHAGASGADARQRCKVTDVSVDDEGASVVFEQEGKEQRATSRWFIDATGRDAFLGRKMKLSRSDNGFPKRIAVYAHFKKIRRNDGEAAGMITIVRIADGWFWIIPLDEEKTSVGFVQGLAGYKAKGRSPEEEFTATVAGCTELRYRFKEAERVGGFYTTGDYCYRHGTFAGARYLLVGDAGGFIDPIFSSGVMMAMKSGRLAAKTILVKDEAGGVLSSRDQKKYTRDVYAMMNVYADMIRMYYDNAAFEVFMNPAPWLMLPRAVLDIVAGNTDLPFRLWWRMKVFYAICRLQKWFAISPRINFTDGTAS